MFIKNYDLFEPGPRELAQKLSALRDSLSLVLLPLRWRQ
jgi:hypothetical protein